MDVWERRGDRFQPRVAEGGGERVSVTAASQQMHLYDKRPLCGVFYSNLTSSISADIEPFWLES